MSSIESIIKKEQPLQIYQAITKSTTISLKRLCDFGIVKIIGARVLKEIFVEKKIELCFSEDTEVQAVIDNTNNTHLKSFEYVSKISQVVYACTILDTFLTETTKFLFLLHPNVLGKDLEIKFEKVLKCGSKFEIINNVINERVRVISFGSIKERIKFLNKHFGLRINISKVMYEQLEYYGNLRNELVHDTSVMKMGLNNEGELSILQIACYHEPKGISRDDSYNAIDAFRITIGKIYEEIRKQIFGKVAYDKTDISLIEFFSEEKFIDNPTKFTTYTAKESRYTE
jgi:hypothetical protein